ncbi:hypothetical protein BOX15_Mlig015051g1 [Macrostomum lignano]|uniref:Uncharacterized protein n=1 Tax=Macrostomum lignano TaxID=282301 RepID=A0A267E9M8_9PLAT|nr:hypothetical protein BOX15_Mlig015051g1 [Macrostomum lignano]
MTHYGGPAVAAIEEQMAAVNIHGEPVGELGWDELPDEKDIPINEDNYSRIRLRLDKPPQPSTCYVFLGDGKENCTFSGAFAQLRRSSRGIFSTDISVEIEEEEEEEQVEQVEQVEQEEQEEQEQDDWPKRLRIDATKMGENRGEFLLKLYPNQEKPSRIVLWFQCPWTAYGQDNQELFLRDIMAAAAKVQNPGELLLIGLCVDTFLFHLASYVKRYGSPKAAAEANGYKCMGADQEFVGEMRSRGYEHRASTDRKLGLERNDQFATLLFQRKKPDPHPTQG